MSLTASDNCINIIKQFEGFRSKAYIDAAGVITIGYGTTNADKSITGVTINTSTTVTEAKAAEWLKKSVNNKYTPRVNKYDSTYHWNQNQLDALVSFAYNIGSIDKLVNYGKNTIAQISASIPNYCHAGGKVLQGLVRRRNIEKELFDKPVSGTSSSTSTTSDDTSARSVSINTALAGTYKVTATSLAMRKTSGADGELICYVSNGSTVSANGTYTTVNGTAWYYCTYGQKSGYMSSKYLSKVVAASKPSVANYTVKNGSSGANAKLLQQDLNYFGSKLTVDGAFGPNSVSALKAWQLSHGLTADGVYGPNSYNKMKSLLG